MTEKLPFVQPPQWLLLAPVSVGAKTLYSLLVMHVNRENPDNRVAWPERETLAEMMGFTRPQSVDPYVTELEHFGAITVTRGRNPKQPLRRRNYYHVVMADDPAPAGAADLSLSDWYRRRAFDAAGVVGSAVERTSDDSKGSPIPSSTPEVRHSAPGEVRSSAPSEVRPAAQELEEVELHQGEKDQSSSAKRAASRAGAELLAPREYCGLNGCKAGSVLVPLDVNPVGIIRCPNCNSADEGRAA